MQQSTKKQALLSSLINSATAARRNEVLLNSKLPKTSFSDRIHILLKKRKLTQKDLAQSLGICTSSMSRYLNNPDQMPLWVFKEMLNILETTPQYLLGMKPSFPKATTSNEKKEEEKLLVWIYRHLNESHQKLLLGIISVFFQNLLDDPASYPEAATFSDEYLARVNNYQMR